MKLYNYPAAYLANIEEIMISETEIAAKVIELSEEITAYYQKNNCRELVVIGILSGAVIFLADLVRHISLPLSIDFMAISSYGDGTDSGKIKITKDLSHSIENKHVLIIEDIIDTGTTYNCLRDLLKTRNPKSLAICALLNKPSRRKTGCKIDFCGFEIPDKFVVGYGLDFAGNYRQLPYIAVLKPEAYKIHNS
jgi:hypoxanthine phosphoribosyltransferase